MKFNGTHSELSTAARTQFDPENQAPLGLSPHVWGFRGRTPARLPIQKVKMRIAAVLHGRFAIFTFLPPHAGKPQVEAQAFSDFVFLPPHAGKPPDWSLGDALKGFLPPHAGKPHRMLVPFLGFICLPPHAGKPRQVGNEVPAAGCLPPQAGKTKQRPICMKVSYFLPLSSHRETSYTQAECAHIRFSPLLIICSWCMVMYKREINAAFKKSRKSRPRPHSYP